MFDRGDIVALTGLILMTGGAWLAWEPAGLLVPGVVLLAIGIMWDARGGR